MNASTGLYRIAQIIKWGGRIFLAFGLFYTIGVIQQEFFGGLLDFLASALHCLKSNALVCTKETSGSVILSVFFFVLFVIGWLIAEGIAWVLEGFANG